MVNLNFLLLSLLVLKIQYSLGVRVCEHFLDYYNPFSKNCQNNPVDKLNTTENIRTWGFTGEEFYLTTEDGYKILINRAYDKITKKNPIILVHGIAMNSLSFVATGQRSLPYVLGKLGYDVYIVNLRGTKYSKNHVYLKPTDLKYWQFSLHEMAIYDTRMVTNHITKKTKEKAIYIGFSMGTTVSFIYTSMFPEEAKNNLQGMVQIAPVLSMEGAKSLLVRLQFARSLVKKELPLLLRTMYDTIGYLVVDQYMQIMGSGEFRALDYGPEKNLEVYNSTEHMWYKIENIQVPVSMIVGENDFLASSEGATMAYNIINPSSRCGLHLVENKRWAHLDFFNGKDRIKMVYDVAINKIRNIEEEKCSE